MKFTCEKALLCEAINNVLPAVSSKSTLIALEGILISCKNQELTCTSYNLELGISKTIEVQSSEDGAVILNASLLSNIVNKMPNGMVTITCDEKLLTVISCNEVEFTILGLNAAEFPDMPAVEGDQSFSLPAFSGSIDFMYNWKERIYAGIDCDFASSRRCAASTALPQLAEVRIPGYADLGVKFGYAFTRKFSLWLRGGNLLDMTIQKSPLYAESGIYFTGGICLNL